MLKSTFQIWRSDEWHEFDHSVRSVFGTRWLFSASSISVERYLLSLSSYIHSFMASDTLRLLCLQAGHLGVNHKFHSMSLEWNLRLTSKIPTLCDAFLFGLFLSSNKKIAAVSLLSSLFLLVVPQVAAVNLYMSCKCDKFALYWNGLWRNPGGA